MEDKNRSLMGGTVDICGVFGGKIPGKRPAALGFLGDTGRLPVRDLPMQARAALVWG